MSLSFLRSNILIQDVFYVLPNYLHYLIFSQALIVAHDDIVNKNFEGDIERTTQLFSPPPPVFQTQEETVRFVNIRKSQTEPLVHCHSFIYFFISALISLMSFVKIFCLV